MTKAKVKPFPELASDAEAEAFVAEADLSEFDWSDMVPVRFEFAPKDARIPYQRFIRRALERAVGRG